LEGERESLGHAEGGEIRTGDELGRYGTAVAGVLDPAVAQVDIEAP
jgi:hypothetical protein